MKRETFTDWCNNQLATNAPGFVALAFYGAWLIGVGIYGAVVERRCMTRKLP